MFSLSRFGQHFTQTSGILELMDDLDRALNDPAADYLMLGGGNPGRIPAIEAAIHRRWQELANDSESLARILGVYDNPQGHLGFRKAAADFFCRNFGWSIDANHVAITNGSQSSFFVLFHLFAGEDPAGMDRPVALPIVPEYIGYSEIGARSDFFVSCRPRIQEQARCEFAYRLDREELNNLPDVGAIAISRPTNPSGNVLPVDDLNALLAAARARKVPFIIDAAYGDPFPGLSFGDDAGNVFPWSADVIYTFSLSKFGMPGARTGIVIARPEVTSLIARISAVLNLAPGSLGPAIARPWFESDWILDASQTILRPEYLKRSKMARDFLIEASGSIPGFSLHENLGAFFLWMRMEHPHFDSASFYDRLKKRGVLVVPGHHYFPGLREAWSHTRECIRISVAQDPATVRKGLQIIVEELRTIADG